MYAAIARAAASSILIVDWKTANLLMTLWLWIVNVTMAHAIYRGGGVFSKILQLINPQTSRSIITGSAEWLMTTLKKSTDFKTSSPRLGMTETAWRMADIFSDVEIQ